MVKTLTKFYGWGGKLDYLIVNEDTVMKKFFKYLGISLASLLLIWVLTNIIFNLLYWDWWKFNEAADHGDIETMSDMLKDGYNPKYITQSDSYYHTNHFEAALINAPNPNEVIEFFLNNGTDIDAPLYNGDTALQISIYIKKPQITEFLIKKGARLDVMSNGMTITDLAVTTNQPEIIMKIPPDKIVIGEKNRNNHVYFARVVKLYDTGKTDARIIDALLKQGFISENYLEEIRTILKKHSELYNLL